MKDPETYDLDPVGSYEYPEPESSGCGCLFGLVLSVAFWVAVLKVLL